MLEGGTLLKCSSLFISSCRKVHFAGFSPGRKGPASAQVRSLMVVAAICLFLIAPFKAAAAMQEAPEEENKLDKQYLKNVLSDQKKIWTSPAEIRGDHLPWLIPFFSVGAGLISTDSNVARQQSRSPSLISNSRNLANVGAASFVAGGAAFYVYGRFAHCREGLHFHESTPCLVGPSPP